MDDSVHQRERVFPKGVCLPQVHGDQFEATPHKLLNQGLLGPSDTRTGGAGRPVVAQCLFIIVCFCCTLRLGNGVRQALRTLFHSIVVLLDVLGVLGPKAGFIQQLSLMKERELLLSILLVPSR